MTQLSSTVSTRALESTAPVPNSSPVSFGTVIFNVPVVQVTLILVGAYLTTLVTTYLPARSASRVAPAEALRYD